MEKTKLNQEVTNVMGMYDVMPTLGNMFGFYNKYQLGNDIFNIKENNIVVFLMETGLLIKYIITVKRENIYP